MSTCTHESMTNHHVPAAFGGPGVVARIGNTLLTWRERLQQRRELAQWSERDIHDAGLSLGEVLYEAGKPFWRA